jgi:hypothetical protein
VSKKLLYLALIVFKIDSNLWNSSVPVFCSLKYDDTVDNSNNKPLMV